MKHVPYSATPTVMAFHNYKPKGHTIPHTWYQHITFKNGKPDVVAILILADIFYWYKPKTMQSKITGQVTRIKAKFAEERLRRSFKYYVDFFKISDDQARAAVARLVAKGLIIQTFKHVHGEDGRIIGKPMYLEPIPEALKKLDEILAQPEPTDPNDEEPLDDDDDMDEEDDDELAEPSPILSGDGSPSPIPFPTISDSNRSPSPIQTGDINKEYAQRIPTENTPTLPSHREGQEAANAAGSGAHAPGGGPDEDVSDGADGDAAHAADAAPTGAGDCPPHSARSPRRPGPQYPETVAWLADPARDCKTADRHGHIPLAIVQARYAAILQRPNVADPMGMLVKDLKRPPTPDELRRVELQLAPGALLPPPGLGEGGVDHVRNNQLRERLMPALYRHGLPLDFMTVLAWPTAADPLLLIDLADAAADAKLDLLMDDLLPALVAVGVDPQLAIEIETRWGVLPQFPAPPPLVEPEAPAPGRAVERVTSPPADHRIAVWWSDQAEWDCQLADAQASRDPRTAVGVIDRLFTWLKAGSWEQGWIVAKDKNIRVQRELDTTHRGRIIDLALAGGQSVNPPAGPPAPLASPYERALDVRKAS